MMKLRIINLGSILILKNYEFKSSIINLTIFPLNLPLALVGVSTLLLNSVSVFRYVCPLRLS